MEEIPEIYKQLARRRSSDLSVQFTKLPLKVTDDLSVFGYIGFFQEGESHIVFRLVRGTFQRRGGLLMTVQMSTLNCDPYWVNITTPCAYVEYSKAEEYLPNIECQWDINLTNINKTILMYRAKTLTLQHLEKLLPNPCDEVTLVEVTIPPSPFYVSDTPLITSMQYNPRAVKKLELSSEHNYQQLTRWMVHFLEDFEIFTNTWTKFRMNLVYDIVKPESPTSGSGLLLLFEDKDFSWNYRVSQGTSATVVVDNLKKEYGQHMLGKL